MKIKPFECSGGYTTFDNSILDCIMPIAKPNTWKVICVTLRQTVGFINPRTGQRKDADRISFSQYLEKTGIKNRNTLKAAIQDALDQGFIIRVPIGNSYEYAINRDYEFDTDSQARAAAESENGTEIVPVQKPYRNQYRNRTENGTEIVPTKEKRKKKNNNADALEDPSAGYTECQRSFLASFGGKRFKTQIQAKTILTLEQAYGAGPVLAFAEWAAKRGLDIGAAVVAAESSVPRWGKNRRPASNGNYPTQNGLPLPSGI